MSLVYEKLSNKSVSEAVNSIKKNLKEQGYGVLWELNFKDKLEEKGLEFEEDYIILEVCDPKKAKEILDINMQAGYALPCKMAVRSVNGKTYLGLTSPETLLGLFDSSELDKHAKSVEATLKLVIEASI